MSADGPERTPVSQELVDRLRAYFAGRVDVSMAFIFGSRAKGTPTRESDIDVAVYFTPRDRLLEIEEDREDEDLRCSRRTAEDAIWAAVEEIAQVEADIVVLNSAPAAVATAALGDGIALLVRDRELYWRFRLAAGSIAEDFHTFIDEFVAIKARSRSLSRIDRSRLLRILDFIDSEVAEAGTFTTLTRELYATRGSLRRDVERWTEIIVNASVDLAKIVLASEGRRIPDTYREALRDLSGLPGFPRDELLRASGFTRLRNLLAHEYLDIRYPEIRRFVDEAPELYGLIARATRDWLTALPGPDQLQERPERDL